MLDSPNVWDDDGYKIGPRQHKPNKTEYFLDCCIELCRVGPNKKELWIVTSLKSDFINPELKRRFRLIHTHEEHTGASQQRPASKNSQLHLDIFSMLFFSEITMPSCRKPEPHDQGQRICKAWAVDVSHT